MGGLRSAEPLSSSATLRSAAIDGFEEIQLGVMGFARRAGSLVLIGGGLAGLGCKPLPPPPDRIVLVVIDTLRADHLSPYTQGRKTPRIEALAQNGRVFTRASSSFHQTTMSMAALFTGRVPSLETGSIEKALAWNGKTWCGMRRFARGEEASCVPKQLPRLAERLSEAGYWTVGVVTNTLLFQPLGYDQGFDEWIEIGRLASSDSTAGYQANPPRERESEHANRAIAAVLDQRPTDHFFLYAHYMEAHDYSAHGVSYATGVRRSDRAVGGLVDILRERNLFDGTVFFLVSDHGERLGELHFTRGGPKHFGNPSFEEVLHVPLIVSPPQAETDPDAYLRSDDVYRMILRTAGIDAPAPGELEEGELFVSEQWYQTYRNGRWKSYRRRGEDSIALVDLEADPAERTDVADEHPEIVANHERRLRELSEGLAAKGVDRTKLTPEDERRLRALGYLGVEEPPTP